MGLSKSIIILETNPPSPIFNNKSAYASWFEDLIQKFNKNVKIKSYNVTLGELPKNFYGINGVIITGSAKEVYENEIWIDKTMELVREIKAEKIPLLGICFGYQLIAKVFGGEVQKNPKGREIGTCMISLLRNARNDELFTGVPAQIKVQESHISAVVILPKNAKLLAKNKYGIQAFRISNESIWGVQFHPEVTPDNLRKVIRFRQNILAEEGLDAQKIHDAVQPTVEAQQILQNFLNIIYANN